jgi:hypothetical protein
MIENQGDLKMKKKTMTVKNTRNLITNKVTAGADLVKEETIEVMDKLKKVASSANRKGKAAVRAIRS